MVDGQLSESIMSLLHLKITASKSQKTDNSYRPGICIDDSDVALTKSKFLQSVALNKTLQIWVGKGNESNVLGHGNIIFVQT